MRKIRCWFINNSFPLQLFFISRIGLFCLVYWSLVMIPVLDLPGLWRAYPENLFLDGWARWDTSWYTDIGTRGYSNVPNDHGQDTAMFPMFPILIYLTNFFVKNGTTSAILVSNVAFFWALIVLFQLLSKRYGNKIAQRTLILICVNPFSFYFCAAYTESIFLLSVVCSFYFCEKKQYLWGALWGAIAGMTKVVGSLLFIPLLILYFEQIDYNWRKIRPNILILMISTLGIISYMFFLLIKFGNPLQFIDSQKKMGGNT